MSLKDEFIIRYFILLTRVDMKKINEYEDKLRQNINPRDIKIELASEIVRMYHSEEAAQRAKEYFIHTFSRKEIPADIPSFKPKIYDIVSVLVESGLVSSKTQARQVLAQGGVKLNGKIVKDPALIVSARSVLQKGKLKFLKVE